MVFVVMSTLGHFGVQQVCFLLGGGEHINKISRGNPVQFCLYVFLCLCVFFFRSQYYTQRII